MSVTWNAVGSDKSFLDITNLTDKEIMFDTVSVTTNANGQAALTDLYAANFFVLGAYTETNTTTRITPYIGAVTGQWWISARKVSDDSKVANTNLDVVIAYMAYITA